MTLHVRILAGKLDRGAGSHVYHKQLACRLVARGYRVSVISMSFDDDVHQLTELTVLQTRAYTESPLLWRIAPIRQYLRCVQGLRVATLEQPDVVIAGEHLLLKEHFRLFPAVPWIYLPHALTVSEEILNYRLPRSLRTISLGLYRHLQRWALQHSWCTLRFSRSGCAYLHCAYRLSKPIRYVVNPMGIDLPDVQVRVPRHRTPQLLIIGRLSHRKGIDIALNALAQLASVPWHLNVVGEGDQRDALICYAATHGLSSRVTFAGPTSEPSQWYSRSDLMLFPSRSESLGLVLLEAMSFSVPCLGFRSDGQLFKNVSDEIIDHGRTGLLALSESDFVEQLRDALLRPEYLIELGRAARLEVQQNHSWEMHLRCYDDLFDQMTCGTNTPA